MNEIEHEGQKYVLKSDIENIIQQRVSKIATRANEAEQQLKEAQGRLSEMEKHVSSSDMLAAQVSELKEQLSSSTQRYERYTSISKHGLVDPDMVETIEYLYDKSQKGVSNKERVQFSEWLDNQVQNPDSAHLMLKPHLQQLQSQIATEEPVSPEEPAIQEQPSAAPPPSMNTGAKPSPDPVSIQNARFGDMDWYAANREQLINEYRKRRRG